jgi:FkbM family methyltransferase
MDLRNQGIRTDVDRTISFALPGADQHVDLAWKAAGPAPTLDDLLAALPRSWAGREITAEVPGLASRIVLRAFTTDVEAFVQVFLRQEYEVTLPFQPKLIIDGGANIGLTSLYFARKYPGATILAVEAERSNYEILRRNVESDPRISPRHAAIWERTAMLGVYGLRASHPARDSNKWGFMVADESAAAFTSAVREQAEKIDEVQGVSIGALLRTSGFDRIDILKLDVEGSEKEIFASAWRHDWLGRVRAIMIETHDSQKEGCAKAFYDAIGPYRYREWTRGDVTIVELADR